MYRKNGHLACKNRAKWVGRGGGLEGCLFGLAQNAQKTSQMLDFQSFANITQVLDFQRFYASLGAGWVGQG